MLPLLIWSPCKAAEGHSGETGLVIRQRSFFMAKGKDEKNNY